VREPREPQSSVSVASAKSATDEAREQVAIDRVVVRVRCENDEPVAGALVDWCTARQAMMHPNDTSATTDEHGVAQLRLTAAEGRTRVAAAKEGYVSAGHDWVVGEGEVTLRLERGHEFEARFTDVQGRPIPDIPLLIYSLHNTDASPKVDGLAAPTPHALYHTTTNAEGIGIFRGLKAGTYSFGYDLEFYVPRECPDEGKFEIPHAPMHMVLEPLVGVLGRVREGRVLAIDAESGGPSPFGLPRWQGQAYWSIHQRKIRASLPNCFLTLGTVPRSRKHEFVDGEVQLKIAALVDGAGWMTGMAPVRIIRTEDVESPRILELAPLQPPVAIELVLRTPNGTLIDTGDLELLTPSPISERDAWVTIPLGKTVRIASGNYRMRPRFMPVGLMLEDGEIRIDGTQSRIELPTDGECQRVSLRWTPPPGGRTNVVHMNRKGTGVVNAMSFGLTGGGTSLWVGNGNVELQLEGGYHMKRIELEFESGMAMPAVLQCRFEWSQ
jgi:hypothetical protein